MDNQKTNKDVKSNNTMGVLPMDLAESTDENNDRWSEIVCMCSSALVKKFLAAFAIVLIAVTTTLIVLTIMNYYKGDNAQKEIIVVTGARESTNLTIDDNDVELFLQVKNKTSESVSRRKKRALSAPDKREHLEVMTDFNDDDMKKARKIIMNYNARCEVGEPNEFCKALVENVKSVKVKKDIKAEDENRSDTPVTRIANDHNNADATTGVFEGEKHLDRKVSTNEPTKKIQHHGTHKSETGSPLDQNPRFQYPYELSSPINYAPEAQPHHNHDSCLLAKLLKQHYPTVQEYFTRPPAHETFPTPPYLFEIPNMDYLEYNPAQFAYEQPKSFLPRYESFAPPPFPHQPQTREDVELQEVKPHNQDVGIALSYKTPEGPVKNESTARSNDCAVGTLPCRNFELCISENQWCDGKVDCSDVSDEIRCDCRKRVDQSRLCDGYYDCPFGEDEMGCFGCDATVFSCDDPDLNARSTCFTKQQRCDNVFNCPNGKDELECNILSPTLHGKPLFPVSNTEGFLQRNYRGHWYSVCVNPYMWAHDACRRETGLIIRPPFIHMARIDPALKITYMNNGFEGLVHTSDSCENSTAVYVTCPALLCGTRVLTTPQLLRQNSLSESRLYGRMKRFHQYNNLYVPIRRYERTPMPFYDATNAIETGTVGNTYPEPRSKRMETESRVVGGNPSQPAAWPWVVALYKDGTFHCGGVILNHRWILSAAHCVTKFWDHYYEIKAGMLRRFSFSPQEQNLKVTHVITNRFYDRKDMTNDLALLRVTPEILFSRWVRPICLPRPDTVGREWKWGPTAGTMCTAVGWGATAEHGADPDHLREVELPIWNKCNHREDLLGNEICAGYAEGGKDSCQGDSGGPLLCRNPLNSQQWYVAGIVSHGLGCARKGEPGVYARVSLQIEWINFHINSANLPTIRPKPECPSFKCVSGIPKCLNISRVCDKIVDCLNAEDELNCDTIRNNLSFENSLSTISVNDFSSSENVNGTFELQRASNPNDNIKSSEKTTASTPSITKNVLDEIIFDEIQEESASKHKSKKKQFAAHGEIDLKPQTNLNTSTSLRNEQVHLNSSISNVKQMETTTKISETTMATTESYSTQTNNETKDSSLHTMLTTDKTEKNQNEVADLVVTTANTPVTNFTHHISLKMTENISTDNPLTTKPFDSSSTTPMPVVQTNDLEDGLRSKERSQDQSANKEIAENNVTNNNTEKNILNNESFPHINVTQEVLIEDNKSFLSKNASENVESKLLPSVMHEVVFVPAKQKKIHHSPRLFNCHRIQQSIPYQLRCDHKADCEDGTDEHGCACADYIATFNEKLLCDGIIDCADGTDEIDCFECDPDHFLCKSSRTCIPTRHVCDETIECPGGEDERDCYALSNGSTMVVDFEGKPKINLEGFLTKRNENSWDVVCEDDLSNSRQEQAANHICRYLGFSGANRYLVKYINIKENKILRGSDTRRRRQTTAVPVKFTYKISDFDEPRHIVIDQPEVLKEHCVPNVTKICMSLYVHCEPTLFTDFSLIDASQDLQLDRSGEPDDKRNSEVARTLWPWAAKIYVDGEYECTGILVDLSWVITGQACLKNSLMSKHYVTAVLGTVRTLNAGHGPHEQSIWVDHMKNLYHIQVMLLHLAHPAVHSNMVRPMVIPSHSEDIKEDACVAIGQDPNNNTLSVFLQATDACETHKRCFVRQSKKDICPPGVDSKRPWIGMVACHTAAGWSPRATFVEHRGECGMKDEITATDLGYLKTDIKPYIGKSVSTNTEAACDGTRCVRGRCVPLIKTCDGVRDCEDGLDETENACEKKRNLCSVDPYQGACECASGELKCRNGRCVSKEVFGDGHDDCADGSDEPPRLTCSQYLAQTAPRRLCDGTLHCADRSDEEPAICKCFSDRTYKCGSLGACVAPDLVCDGIRDCPNGDDERTCLGLKAPEGAAHGTGEVIKRSFGVWHTKCYSKINHTRTELENICRELGFLSGHARQLPSLKSPSPYTKVITDVFSDVILNNSTNIKLRSSDSPFATSVPDENKECYPVHIECL